MKPVLDGSAALATLLPEENISAKAKIIKRAIEESDDLAVPAHWFAEVTNGLIVAERRQRITEAEATELLEMVSEFGVIVDEETIDRVPRDVAALARLHKLTVYDAAYLELAMRRGAALVTLDAELRRAAVKSGVKLIP